MVPGIGRQMSRNQMAHSMSRGHKKCLRMELMPKKSKKRQVLISSHKTRLTVLLAISGPAEKGLPGGSLGFWP